MDELAGATTFANATGGTVLTRSNALPFPASGSAAIFAGSPRSVTLTTEGGLLAIGSGTELSIPGDVTVMALVIFTATLTGYPRIADKPTQEFYGRSNYQISANYTNSKIFGRVNIASAYYTVEQSGTLSLDTPYMVLLRRSGTALTLWLNGALQGTLTIPSGNLDTSTQDFFIGRPSSSYDNVTDFDGARISCVAVWNRALTNQEISDLWTYRNSV